MPYSMLSPNVFDCDVCPTRCNGVTAPKFDFEKDVEFSEAIENSLIKFFNSNYPQLSFTKTTAAGYPDIEVRGKSSGKLLYLVEVKAQSRTFMNVAKRLPGSGLKPSETMALNLSDLERYVQVSHETNIPVYLVWCLLQRPCITGTGISNKKYYYRGLQFLKSIRERDVNDTRRFRRASGDGDVVNGQHKGVVVNYHFSLNELLPGLPRFYVL